MPSALRERRRVRRGELAQGVYLTDGDGLYEVREVRGKVRTGGGVAHELTHALLVDVSDDVGTDGAWIPVAEVEALCVVIPQAEEVRPPT